MTLMPKKDNGIKKPRIALACPSFSGGGAERVMVTLANKFIEWGYSVDFVIGTDKGPYKNMLSHQANKIVLTNESAGRIKKKLIAGIRLYQYLRKTDSKALMSTIREFNIFIGSINFIASAKCPIILREAAALDVSHFNGSATKKIKLLLMRYFYKSADRVIANSNATKDDLIFFLGLSSDNICTIYNPLNIKICKREENKIKVIGSGRLVKNKNFKDLIKAIPYVQEKYPDVQLDILGQGPEKENLHKLIDDLGLIKTVNLVGFVDNPYQHYASASVFVQTSLWEGFGYVLAEAMACSTPVVAYDSKGAMREILADGKYGLLTPVGDLQALADAIIQQIEQPTPVDLLEEAVQRFDEDLIAKQYLEALGVTHE